MTSLQFKFASKHLSLELKGNMGPIRNSDSIKPQIHYWTMYVTKKHSWIPLCTHTALFLDDLQNPFSRKQEVNEAAESVPTVLSLHHAEELPEDGGSSGTKGTVQGRQGPLDTMV